MSFTDHIQVLPMVEVGEPVNGAARANKRPAQLSASSSEALLPGMGVCLSSSIGNYRPLVALPSSASSVFYGIVPADAIPSAEEAAFNGETAGQVMPGKVFAVGVAAPEGAQWRVPLPSGTSTANAQAYWIFTGANAGKWATGTGLVSQVTRGTVVANNGDAVGLDVDSLPRIEVTSTASASGTATLLADKWNASAQHYAVAVASTDSADILLTFAGGSAHTVAAYSPATADITPIANDTAAVAATAVAVPGAYFRVAASTYTIVELT